MVIGAKCHSDGVLPYEPETDSTVPGMLAARFAERSPSGAGAFGSMAERFRTMTTTEPTLTTTDLAAIGAPTLVLAGDDDLIDLAHTIQPYQALPFAHLGVIPGASHASRLNVLSSRPNSPSSLSTRTSNPRDDAPSSTDTKQALNHHDGLCQPGGLVAIRTVAEVSRPSRSDT